MAATFEKHVVDEKLKKTASIDRVSNNSPTNRSDSNGVESTNQSRDGTPVERHRSPTAQDTAKNTPPLSKQSSQSPKSKPSTPVSGQKRSDSIDEINDKVNNMSISKNKNVDILSNRDEALTCQVNKKRGAGFKTDREYLEDEHDDQHDLEAWQPEHPYEEEEHIDSNVNRGRWTVDEMFRANDQLGVRSTYNGINEYSTAMPEGDDDAKKRAHEIALEIEGSKDSQRNKRLENDDEERDLDKETRFDPDNRNQKRQSGGGYQNKGNRSGYSGSGGMRNDNRNYSNSSRNSYPNSGSGASSGSNRYGNSQSRQQRGSYASNFSGSNSRQTAPTTTSWRTESPQQPPQQLSSVQTTNYANKPTAKSPSLHSEERRQSASPATSKYSTDSSTSIRRTNSVQNRQQPVQQPSYSPRPDSYAQGDRRVSDNRYYDGSTPASLPPTANQQPHPQVEIQPIITPIPRQANTPHSQSSYDTQPSQQQYSNEPNQEGASNDESADKPKKKFTFNPNAEVFVPKSTPQMKTTPTPVATPSAIPIQMNMSQHNQPVVMSNYNGQQMVQMPTIPMQMQQPLLVQQPQGYPQPMAQQIPASMPVVQQRVYPTMDYVNNGKLMDSAQQQKYVAAAPIPLQPHQMLAQQVQYVPQNQYPQHLVSQQMQLNTVQHPQLTGQISYAANQTGMPYQQAPPLVHQQQLIYPTNYSYGGQ